MLGGSFGLPEAKEPGQCDDEASEGEEEDQRIVADVDDIVDVIVCYPAPWDRRTSVKERKDGSVG